jgi:uncharacterized alpha-E superfamily protein
MMLSRLAHQVYWIGRLVERSESISLLLSSYHYSATQLGEIDATEALQDLMAGFGEPGQGAPTFPQLAAWWVNDRRNPTSASSCLLGARENARGARESLSLEAWETLTDAADWLDDAELRGIWYETVARQIPLFTRTFSGVVETTMAHDDAWGVLRLGRALERATMTLRALLIGVQAADRMHTWTVTLRACTALDAYRRTKVTVPRAEPVIDLLLRSEVCPRSVRYTVTEAQRFGPADGDAPKLLREILDMTARSVPTELMDAAERIDHLLDLLDRAHEAIVNWWRGR